MISETDAWADAPERLLAAERAAVREHIERRPTGDHPGVEVFRQAEAIFGTAEVPRAEFAAWLHFAAAMLGHEAYAERIAAAEPGMPWRTVWAWWRPVRTYSAHPNLTYPEALGLQHHNGRELLRVKAAWEDTWLDLETGSPVPAPPEEATAPLPSRHDAVPRLNDSALYAPESWAHATPLVAPDGRTRYLVADTCGLALLDTDPDVLRDWPRGGLDHTSALEGTPGRVPSRPVPAGPLTAGRVDAAFAPVDVVRTPGHELPDALEHPGSRAHLRDVGLPSWWACAWTTFEPCPAAEMTPPGEAELTGVALPAGVEAADLLLLGSSEHGELYLHRREGGVHIVTEGECVRLSPGLDHFTRVLEGVRRYMEACWHPRPGEDATEDFFAELDALAPDTLDPGSRSGEVWEYFTAGVTVLNEDGF
ncbi:SUKH-4 family immunity protein [Streptomyces sp. bgisy100]|uniref:SUKH-4 family immunity protein n=1 Tax=Streptomyces sp. bgisy100 TaxID=3413783 RepID=UPI003D72B94C